ncbi:type 1 fimbrial protein [Neisseriaceae bacterium TC5R-5]|nr:type 1 fimbrial protein [Neisseriaceae bacterium TC5R-5]
MKKLLLAIATAALSITSVTTLANNINFQGELTTNSCSLTFNGSTDPVILLPTVATTALAKAGDVTGKTRFSLGVTACLGPTTPYIRFIGNNISTASGTFGGDANVKLQLLGVNGAAAKFSADGAYFTLPPLTNGSGSGTLYVQYYAETTSTKTAGAITGNLQYAITYQ